MGFFDLVAHDINGNQVDLKEKLCKDAVATLVVNVASNSSLTDSHYKSLTQFYRRYKE